MMVTRSVDQVVRQLSSRAAVISSRREFIGRVLRGAAAVGFGLATWQWGPSPATASHSPCGPSPDCPSGCCSWWTCTGTCKNANYGHTTCRVATAGCWYVPWYGFATYCCDCCGSNATGNPCPSGNACNGWKKCTCWWGSF